MAIMHFDLLSFTGYVSRYVKRRNATGPANIHTEDAWSSLRNWEYTSLSVTVCLKKSV